jgi:hypothetical protein
MSSRERRPSPALVVSVIALAVALSGTAMALPGKNTVDSGDIVKKQVKASDLAKGAAKAPKIAANAVRSGKIKDGTVTGADLAPDTINRGQIGAGAVWAAELGTIHDRTETANVGSGGSSNFATANCVGNEQVISGGAEWAGLGLVLAESYRSGNGWFARGQNNGGSDKILTVHAYCLQAPIPLPPP